MAENIPENHLQFMKGGGEAGAQLRARNWNESPLGNPAEWPASIRMSLSMCLNSSFPISLYWGPDYYVFYNDAYRAIAGDRHPGIIGKPRREAWPEAWQEIKPQFDAVMSSGESVRFKDKPFLIHRFGFIEECYFDYTLSPIADEEGKICGIFNAVMETTYQVINERRNHLLQHLSLQLHNFQSRREGFGKSIDLLQHFTHDIPFSLLYEYDAVSETFTLTQSNVLSTLQAGQALWPLKETITSGAPVMIDGLQNRIVDFDFAGMPVADLKAIAVPVKQGEDNITGVFIAGLNTSVRLDDSYRQFLESVAAQIAAAISNGINFEKERLRSDQIKYSEDQLQFAIDAAGLGTWDLDPFTNRFTGNNRLKSWFGLLPDDEIDLSLALNVITDADRPLVVSAIQEAMTSGSGGNYNIEYTIINPLDPVPRIVCAKGKALFDNEHNVTRFSGTLQDITAERKTLDALERSFEQARLSKEAAQLGTFDMDLVKGTMEWDERCRLLFGISHNRKVSYEDDFLPGLHPMDQERIGAVIIKAFNKSESNGDYDVEYRTVGAEDQQLRWVRAKGKVFFNDQDEPIRFIGSVLETTNEKLNEIRKNDFIGMVSHELKTPLTSLKAYVQVLNARSRKEENSFAISSLNKVELQINKMSALINGFLNLSRLESGKIQLNRIDFKIDDLIREIIEESSLVVSTHRIVLLPCDSVVINADRDKIGQVITNLISNAVKYSPRGEIVELVCKQIDDTVQVSIRDDGMGIRAQDKDKLFERFYRVETVHTENISGFGIGLYLSSEIVKRHGGTIWVESEKGVGSTFFFSLPVYETKQPE
ncbi:PAS fold-containing protein [Pedobacter westerhofensis]|uniref:histidine kinase n=1 Tax=Pedobacter westerhofensis TaxID=425512 RepID=A0A521EYD9_9SPHI|nr:ATP-binding protein [Pedobacter westerhofensis]SMO88846.1 PAS fold-containing protein [Pedobacter westerhofensis]